MNSNLLVSASIQYDRIKDKKESHVEDEGAIFETHALNVVVEWVGLSHVRLDWVLICARRPVILIAIIHGFPITYRQIAGQYPKLGQGRLLPYQLQLIIH
jgi:hypothetical protein